LSCLDLTLLLGMRLQLCLHNFLCVSASQNHRVADVVPAIFMKLMNIHEPLMNFWRFCAPRELSSRRCLRR
jgi:hypothetical protein